MLVRSISSISLSSIWDRPGALRVADSLLGTIWAVPFDGSGARPWLVAPALAPRFFLGANGIEARRDAVFVTNSDSGVARLGCDDDGDDDER